MVNTRDSAPAPSPQPAGFTSESAHAASPSTTRPSEAVHTALDHQDQKPVRCAKFRQQELWAWKPVWSPRVVIIMYAIVTVIFIPLGVVIFVQSTRLYSSPFIRYDDRNCDVGDVTTKDTAPHTCIKTFTVDKTVKAPSYFYYGITNFYQNARTYIDSRSDPQLRGTNNPDTSTCEPLELNASTNNVLVPCGLIAQSKFNDSFRIFSVNASKAITLDGTGISWDIDRNNRFTGSPDYEPDAQKTITDEDFMVWMRVSAYRNWKKLYRKITDDLDPGTYQVRVESNYPVSSFDGKKFFFISETTWFGGPNQALGIVYIVVGAVALLVAIIFSIRSRLTQDLDLPPETTVRLDGLVKSPFNVQESSESQQETV